MGTLLYQMAAFVPSQWYLFWQQLRQKGWRILFYCQAFVYHWRDFSKTQWRVGRNLLKDFVHPSVHRKKGLGMNDDLIENDIF